MRSSRCVTGRGCGFLGVVDECVAGPGENAGCTISLRTTYRPERSSGLVIAVETSSVYEDYDLGDPAGGARVHRRHFSVCSRDGCPISAPLETIVSTIELFPRRARSGWPDRERVTSQHRAIAVAALRRDGSVRLTLREGDWRTLFEDTRDYAAQPERSVRAVTFSLTAPEPPAAVTPGVDSLDQSRGMRAAPSSTMERAVDPRR